MREAYSVKRLGGKVLADLSAWRRFGEDAGFMQWLTRMEQKPGLSLFLG